MQRGAHLNYESHLYCKIFFKVRFNVGGSNICQLCNLEIEHLTQLNTWFFCKHSVMMHSLGCTKDCKTDLMGN